jgi:TfoX/Sxy family transcriptional regulator of competence genes
VFALTGFSSKTVFRTSEHMASNQDFIDYVCEQVNLAERVTYKRMFGEYALYVNGKVVGFVCDNQLFVKPTVLGKELVGNIAEAPPYPGAKLYFLLSERLDDRDFMRQLFLVTASELPAPKPKAKAKPKVKATVGVKMPTQPKAKRSTN